MPAPDYACGGFTLSRPATQVLRTVLISRMDGKPYRVDADFRTVLACLRRLNNPDKTDTEKLIYLAARFFLRNPPMDMDSLFAGFVLGGDAAQSQDTPLMDMEVDAGAIYASFLQQYGIDLLTQSLHWVVFRELLAGLTEATPLGQRVRLRALDESRFAAEERGEIRKAKERIAITPRVNREEQMLLNKLNQKLAAGEDPAAILAQLQEV